MNNSIGNIYNELSSNTMKKFTGNSALWNMSEPIVLVLKKFIVEEMERVQLNNQTNDVPLDIEEIDEEDCKFLYGFYKLFDFFLMGNLQNTMIH